MRRISFLDDERTIRQALLCARGQEVTPSMRARLRNYAANVGIQTPIKIFVPMEMADQEAFTQSES